MLTTGTPGRTRPSLCILVLLLCLFPFTSPFTTPVVSPPNLRRPNLGFNHRHTLTFPFESRPCSVQIRSDATRLNMVGLAGACAKFRKSWTSYLVSEKIFMTYDVPFRRGKRCLPPLFLTRLDILYSQIYSSLQEEHTVKSTASLATCDISFLSHLNPSRPVVVGPT